MTNDTKNAETRAVEVELEIAAPVDAVWKALTDAEELVRWFPLQAEVEPREGGRVWSSWRGLYEGAATITVWEPERKLVITYPETPCAEVGALPAEIATTYELAGSGGRTQLRLVHSGFSAGAEWDDMYDGTQRGWNFELRGLKHYLERHRGTPREVAWSRAIYAIPVPEAWERLVSRALPEVDLAATREGDEVTLETPHGDSWRATVAIATPPHDFAAFVGDVNDAYLRFRLDPSFTERGKNEANFYLSTYGIDAARVAEIEESWTAFLAELLA